MVMMVMLVLVVMVVTVTVDWWWVRMLNIVLASHTSLVERESDQSCTNSLLSVISHHTTSSFKHQEGKTCNLEKQRGENHNQQNSLLPL